MRLSDAKGALDLVALRRVGDILPLSEIEGQSDKGIVGKLLERSLGMAASTRPLDFEDGELKTNSVYPDGRPRETMFITQVSSWVDDLLGGVRFERTILFAKTRSILYVPVVKQGPAADWRFLRPIHYEDRMSHLSSRLRADYYGIAERLQRLVEHGADGMFHTTNGTYLQVRTKDSRPYHPMFSEQYGRHVSNKNWAFYFMKRFMSDLCRQASEPTMKISRTGSINV